MNAQAPSTSNRVIILTLLALLFYSSSQADVIILKNGRSIQVEQIWQENGMIMGLMHGEAVGYPQNAVDRIIQDPEKPKFKQPEGFQFDVWRSGMKIKEAMDTAQRNDIPLHRSGLAFLNKRFNPDVCRKYMHTATEFYYHAALMGKTAVVTLYFTGESKELYKIKILFPVIGANKNSDFAKEIETVLTRKYGKPGKSLLPHPFQNDTTWKIKDRFTVAMTARNSSVETIYTDLNLEKAATQQTKAIEARKWQERHFADDDKF